MKSDIFHRDENSMIPEDKSLFNDNLLEAIHPGFHLLEKENAYIAEIEVAGMTKDDFKINFDGGVLYITGKPKPVDSEEPCDEASFRPFQQSFLLPEDADPLSLDMNIENGILHIRIDKTGIESSESIRRIPIEEKPVEPEQGARPKKEVFHSRSVVDNRPEQQGVLSSIFRRIRNIFK